MFRTVFPPGAAHERHLHSRADEFFYVISGRAAAGAGDREQEAVAGTLQWIPRGIVHWLRNLDAVEPVVLVGAYVGAGSLEDSGYEFVSEITDEYRTIR
jgi:quercetin dioxygenase-like cupin family protein